jgi:hypothetical protein
MEMMREKYFELLPVPLTDTEKLQASTRLADLNVEIETAELERKKQNEAYAAQKKEKKALILSLCKRLKEGMKSGKVKCYWVYDNPSLGLQTLYRQDTGERIRTEEMPRQNHVKKDAQLSLPIPREPNRMTCPRCRQRILDILDYHRYMGEKEKVKELQKRYLPMIRRGSWKQESTVTVYCLLPDIKEGGICCYHLNAKELRGMLHTPKKDRIHEEVFTEFWRLRDKLKMSEKDACMELQTKMGYTAGTILRIAHTRN